MKSRYPSELWLFFIYGSFLGGALVTALADGRAGMKIYFRRIVRWRTGANWYAVALLLPLLLRLVAFAASLATGARILPEARFPDIGNLVFGFFFILLVVALGEEPGFRGFALPRFPARYTAIVASLILGVLHAIWHLPLFVTGEESVVIIPIIISGAVLNTWLFIHTGGSVFIAMFLHSSVTLWVGVFNPVLGEAETRMMTVWLAAAYVVMAAILTMLAGPHLTRGSKSSTASAVAGTAP